MKCATMAMGLVLLCGQIGLGGWQFEWEGVVTGIEDADGVDVSWGSATVGDTVSVSLQYDPATFADGVDVSGDGLDYAHPPASLWMEYSFSSSSSTTYAHSVTSVRARDGGTFDQWNWTSGDDLLLQQNDDTDSSWDLPLPASFADMHDLYVDAFSRLIPSNGTSFVWDGHGPDEGKMWRVLIRVTDWDLTSDELSPGTIPAPAAVLLTGLGAGLVGWLRRRRGL